MIKILLVFLLTCLFVSSIVPVCELAKQLGFKLKHIFAVIGVGFVSLAILVSIVCLF